MIGILKRLSILFLLLLLVLGAAEHLFLTVPGTNHTAQEASCPIHGGVVQSEQAQPLPHVSVQLIGEGGVVQSEQAQPLPHVSVQLIGEIRDNSSAFDLSAKIAHPPTI